MAPNTNNLRPFVITCAPSIYQRTYEMQYLRPFAKQRLFCEGAQEAQVVWDGGYPAPLGAKPPRGECTEMTLALSCWTRRGLVTSHHPGLDTVPSHSRGVPFLRSLVPPGGAVPYMSGAVATAGSLPFPAVAPQGRAHEEPCNDR